MRSARPLLGVFVVLTASALFAFNGTVSKLLLRGGFDAPQLSTFRAAGAAIGLLVLCLTLPSPSGPRWRRLAVSRRELPLLIGFGLTGFFLVPMLYFVAISRLPVGIGLLFEYMGPLFVALWVRFGERQLVKRRLWLGLGLCLIGLSSVAQVWTGSIKLDQVGVAAGLACAVLLGAYYVLGSKSVGTRDPLSATFWAFAFAAVAGAIVRPWWNFPGHLLLGESDGQPMWLLALYLIVCGSIIAYLLVTMAMRHLPPTSVGIIGMNEPVLASLFAWALLGEVLTPPQLIGGVIVLTGVILAETARATARPEPVQPTAPAESHPEVRALTMTPDIPTV